MNIVIAKTHNLVIDESRFNAAVKEFIWNYGLVQIIRDAGSTGQDADEKLAMAQKRLDSLYAGKLRAERDPSAAADPIGKEMYRLAKADVIAAVGKDLKNLTKDQVKAVILAQLDAEHADYEALARRNLGEVKKISINLAALLK